jgi:ABC-2 type transport system ATP-binding protein
VSTSAIEIHGLRKTYRRRGRTAQAALDGLDLTVQSGGVHGFLGPNGSGKTTTIRILLGLASADGGTARIFGRAVPAELPLVVGHVGALVENPLFLPGMSGRAQLWLLAQSVGVPRTRVEEVLERVALRERADERVKGYSLGMRQRLGIAAALLKDPRLLILDEPSNGLDPAGMKEMRDLVRQLGADGHTVFLSSHLLGEVQQVCDSVAILSRGRCLVHGPVRDVLAAHTTGAVTVAVADPERAAEVLREGGYDVHAAPDGRLQVTRSGPQPADPAQLNRLLGERGLWASEITPVAADLESAFLEITRGQGLGEGEAA